MSLSLILDQQLRTLQVIIFSYLNFCLSETQSGLAAILHDYFRFGYIICKVQSLLHLYLVLYSRLCLKCSFVHLFLLQTTVFFTDDGNGTLKESLLDELDYVLVPSESWDLLVKWYGTVDQNTAIPRQVSLFVALHFILVVYFLNQCMHADLHMFLCFITRLFVQ